MITKIKTTLAAPHRRIIMTSLLTMLVLAAITVTAVAASGGFDSRLVRVENGTASYSLDDGATWNTGLPEGGVTRYSLDDGATWHEGQPPAGSEEKSLVTHGEGTPPQPGEGDSMMVQNNGGVTRYSTDGGQTWTEHAPSGVTVTEEADGRVTIRNEVGNG